MINTNKKNIIDCTLRDGGYYNNWDFSKDLVECYLRSMSLIGIKFIELGFRSIKTKTFKGPCWHTTDEYISSLKVPRKLVLGVMVNVSEYTNKENIININLNKIFKKNSKIKFVRLAAHAEEIETAILLSEKLNQKGFTVILNLMQISEISLDNLEIILKKINKSPIKIFYFADSLGNLTPENVSKIVVHVKKFTDLPIGIHAHDNMSRALENTITANKLGCSWLDCTVLGMGRGPGNVQTEQLYLESMTNISSNKKKELYALVNKYFMPLKEKYKWGTNFFYFLSGKYKIHPTYIQEMLSLKYPYEEIIEVIDQLKTQSANRYEVDLIRLDFKKNLKLKLGTWSAKKNQKNKEVLLIAAGKSLKDYKFILEKYIKIKKPFVIGLNPNLNIDKKLINIYAVCNPLNLISEVNNYKKLNSTVVTPTSLISENIKKKLKNIKILNFGVGLYENTFKFFDKGVIIPRLYTLSYALGLATSGQCKRILLAGFDGYGSENSRNQEVNKIFYQYSQSKNSKDILAITPTTYALESVSIYAFL